jgi:hypothetical protein
MMRLAQYIQPTQEFSRARRALRACDSAPQRPPQPPDSRTTAQHIAAHTSHKSSTREPAVHAPDLTARSFSRAMRLRSSSSSRVRDAACASAERGRGAARRMRPREGSSGRAVATSRTESGCGRPAAAPAGHGKAGEIAYRSRGWSLQSDMSPKESPGSPQRHWIARGSLAFSGMESHSADWPAAGTHRAAPRPWSVPRGPPSPSQPPHRGRGTPGGP